MTLLRPVSLLVVVMVVVVNKTEQQQLNFTMTRTVSNEVTAFVCGVLLCCCFVVCGLKCHR